MPYVNCDLTDCIHNNWNCRCTAEIVFLNFETDHDNKYDCGTYESITDGPDYQEEFYKRVRNKKTGREEKKKAKGKKIELHGLTFFTEYDTRFTDDYSITEKETGYLLTSKALNEHLDKVLNALKNISPVIDLCEYQFDDIGYNKDGNKW